MCKEDYHSIPVTISAKIKICAKQDGYQGLNSYIKPCLCMSILVAMAITTGCDFNRDNDEYSDSSSPSVIRAADITPQENQQDIDNSINPVLQTTIDAETANDQLIAADSLQTTAQQIKVQSPSCASQIQTSTPLTSETVAPVISASTKPSPVSACVEFELNSLDFSPVQPWLSDIMWQTIAHQVVPDKTLSNEGGTAKIAVRMVLRQIRGLQSPALNLPIYQYINTEFNGNKNQTGYLKIDSIQQRYEHSPKLKYSYYKMVDIADKKQLSFNDILNPKYNKETLLMLLQQMPKASQSESELIYHLPIDLPAQWYMDDAGLHLLYQPGEMIEEALDIQATRTENNNNLNRIIEMVVPYEIINIILKPQYKMHVSATGSDAEGHIQLQANSKARDDQEVAENSNTNTAVLDKDYMAVISIDTPPIIVRQLAYD